MEIFKLMLSKQIFYIKIITHSSVLIFIITLRCANPFNHIFIFMHGLLPKY